MSMWKNLSTAFTKQETGSGFHDFFESKFNIDLIAPDMRDSVLEHRRELANMEIFRKTTAAVRKLRHSDGTECIRQLETIGEFQHANPLLQPFLVAMPEYRKPYNEFMASGYEKGFSELDIFRGNAYMHTDDNYREMTTDVSTEYDENRIWHWVTNEDRQYRPDAVAKVELNINRVRMRDFDWEDADPCSQFNASM